MSKRTGLILALSVPLLLLAGCMDEKEKAPIEPDKEPVQIAQEEDSDEPKSISMSEATKLFSSDKALDDYKADFKEYGYKKPDRVISLGSFADKDKKGIVYKVEDGYAMIEYNESTEEVLAITGYQNEVDLKLQEMKTKAYQKENDMALEKDPEKKEALKREVDSMWENISKIEQAEI